MVIGMGSVGGAPKGGWGWDQGGEGTLRGEGVMAVGMGSGEGTGDGLRDAAIGVQRQQKATALQMDGGLWGGGGQWDTEQSSSVRNGLKHTEKRGTK